MRRSHRQILAIALVALHATVMLCGPCLHALPGWGHGNGLAHETQGDRLRDPIPVAHLQADDCPVCHFLSQAQLPLDVVSVPVIQKVATCRPEIVSEPRAVDRLHPTSPRAPPARATSASIA
jgi:hypothetical protein